MATADITTSFVHNNPGPVAIAFSPDGSTIYTGGGDSLARVIPVKDKDAEADTATEAADVVTSVAATSQYWIAASADSSVRKYKHATSELVGFITTAKSIPIRCVAVDPKGGHVAVASDDLEIKVIDLEDITKFKVLQGHKTGVRKVTWNPSGSILAATSQDGRITIWDLMEDEPKAVKTIEGLAPIADPDAPAFANDCSVVWHPSSKHFYIATATHDIIAVSSESWSKSAKFSDEDLSGEVTALTVSPNGMYLASACESGIFIWSIQSRKVLFRHKPDLFSQICQLAFSPTQNLLAWSDTDGNLYRWNTPIPSSHSDPVRKPSGKDGMLKEAMEDKDAMDGVDEEDYGDDVNLEDDEWIIDDLNGQGGFTGEKKVSFAREMVNVTKAQLSFQPGSTPARNKRRYLAFNSLGVIEIADQDTHHVVNVEFHDRSTYNSHHFTDHHKFSLASLGPRGIAYAAPIEGSNPSQLAYKPYAGWGRGSSGDWQVALPEGENVVAIAAGGTPTRRSYKGKNSEEGESQGAGNVVVATDKGYIRFFTGSGMQRYIWSLADDVVSMVAGKEWVFVVHREGGTSLDGCQNLRYSLVALDTFDIIQEGRLPLPRGRAVSWIGVSDEGAPAMYDSAGILSVLDRFRRPMQGRWIPILDTNTLARRQGKDESYWPIGLTGTLFLCLILKGRDEYPAWPRPLVQELEVQLPMLNLHEPQGFEEEKYARDSILLGWNKDALVDAVLTTDEIAKGELALDKGLIKLMQTAIKANELQRAHDIVRLMHHSTSLDMALKMAQFYHLLGLEEKIKDWKRVVQDRERLEEERDARREWRNVGRPVGMGEELVSAQFGLYSERPDGFDTAAFPRKSLGSAKPINGTTAFSKKSNEAGNFTSSSTTAHGDDIHNYGRGSPSADGEIDVDMSVDLTPAPASRKSSPSSDGKRKREQEESVDVDVGNSAKKARLEARAKPVPTTNPFAKKVPAVVPATAKPNPFARNGSGAKSMTKSMSFFEKVDAAEGYSGPGGDKKKVGRPAKGEKSDKGKGECEKGPKQTTLFGVPAAVSDPSAKKPNTSTKSGLSKVTSPEENETQETKDSTTDSQATAICDVQGDEEMEETQALDQAPAEGQRGMNDDDEDPIEWPDSPPPQSEVD